MSIPARFLDEIRNRLNLSEVIGNRIAVTRAGREYKACCPFHHEKTPSFTINDDKQFYHCFGCGAHGDVVGFVMQYDNLSFIDAVEKLAAEAGLQMPKPDPQAVQKAEKAKGLHELMDTATLWMQEQVEKPENADVREYLEKRGMDAEIRARFRVGYTPADGQALRKFLSLKGFSDAQMIEAGVLKQSNKGKDPYVFFRDRVMFPVSDRRGRVVAYGGRILPEHLRPQTDPNFKPPKYINSADTPLFDKGRMLYGESLARQAAREGHTLIVTEGYMDVIACHKAGFKGAVAPMGTALTEDQILSLWKMMVDEDKQPVLCFDGDNAGRSAASRACERILPLLKPGRTARFAFLPEGEDPDSILRSKGPGAFKAVLQSSLSLFDFIWATHTAGRSFETPESRAGLSKALEKEVGAIADAEIQRHYRELIRSRIADNFFKPYKGEKRRSGPQKTVPAMRLRPLQNKKNRAVQNILVAAVMNNPGLFAAIEESFGQFAIEDTRLNHLRQEVVEQLTVAPDLDFETLSSNLKSTGFDKEIDDILSESVYVHAAFARSGALERLGEETVQGQWMELYNGLQEQSLGDEVKAGWRAAFETSNEEEEGRLRDIVRIRGSE